MGLQAIYPRVNGTVLHLSKLEQLSSPAVHARSGARVPLTAGKGVSSPAFVQLVFSDLLLGNKNNDVERFVTESTSHSPAVKTASQFRCSSQHCTKDCFLEERLCV